MALNFYLDVGLKNKVNASSPKRFLFPNAGGKKASQLWLGDPYTSTCTVEAHAGDSTISLADTGEFFSDADIAAMSGGLATAQSGAQVFTYTGKTQSELTGVVGITSDILVGDVVYPKVVYNGVHNANIRVFPTGSDLLNFGVKVRLGPTSILGFEGFPAIFSQDSIAIGVANAVEVYMSVAVPAGVDKEFTNFAVQCNNLFKRDVADTTVFSVVEGTYSPIGDIYAYRHDQGLSLPIRLLPRNRRVSSSVPGFIVGEYRWRDSNDRNATALVPTNWNIDPNVIGYEKFIAGIGDQDDLEPQGLVEVQDSIRMMVHRGEYFTGARGYYLPADWNLEFLGSSINAANGNGTVTLVLEKTPEPIEPRFIGTYVLDQQGFYEKSIEYKYMCSLLNPNGTPRTDLPDRYYTLDRKTRTVILNKSMGHPLVFLGLVSGQAIDYFDIPVYPVDNVDIIYVARGASVLPLYATTWTFNREEGTVQVPSIPGALAGQPIFAFCSPAVAVLYDSGPDVDRRIDTVDFNPAFSGLANGYFYLQHRRQKPVSLVLSCDKPRIAIPATQDSLIGLIAFGPVYFENDFALLKVTAYSAIPGETIPNAKLDVVVDSNTFTGTINYKDPLAETVSVVTGGDGTANLIFIPKGGFGTWLPTTPAVGITVGGLATTTVLDDTLVLPAAIPLSQIWNAQEGWLVTTYQVLNNDPLFGMVGGDPALGEVVWQTTGTPGLVGYKTNGERKVWRDDNTTGGAVVLPIDALDSAGHSYTSAAFSGTVQKLVYAKSLPTADPSVTIVGAYFLTFVQRVLVKMKLENSDLYSNSILLQMDTPDLILENPWLILDDAIQGYLDHFRLGYVRRS